MNHKRNKIIYLSATILLSAIMLLSIGMYFFNHQAIGQSFQDLGYPAYLVYPLGIAKILGLIAIWSKKSDILKEWSYAGFFFTLVLAISAHLVTNDGEFGVALLALILLIVSYLYDKKLQAKYL